MFHWGFIPVYVLKLNLFIIMNIENTRKFVMLQFGGGAGSTFLFFQFISSFLILSKTHFCVLKLDEFICLNSQFVDIPLSPLPFPPSRQYIQTSKPIKNINFDQSNYLTLIDTKLTFSFVFRTTASIFSWFIGSDSRQHDIVEIATPNLGTIYFFYLPLVTTASLFL